MNRSPMTANMWRVLKFVAKNGWVSAQDANCGISTLQALELRGLIRVETTFASVLFPQTAHAWITDEGRRKITCAKKKK